MQWKNIRVLQRDINGYKKGYQSRTNVVKRGKSKVRAFSYGMFNSVRVAYLRHWVCVGLVPVRFGFLSAVSTFCNTFTLLIRFRMKDCLDIERSLSFYMFI
jgi:hypothetical protein